MPLIRHSVPRGAPAIHIAVFREGEDSVNGFLLTQE
jgi:hypothetical protein